jgi:tetratricopeptide (TPR) repeat protein
MARIADILGWKEAQAHLMQIPTTVQADSNSCGGPGGLIHLAEMIAAGEVELEKAQPLAQQLAVPDNELECISLFAMQDDTLERSGVAFALMRLCVAQIVDPRQTARFYRVLGMIAQEHEAKLQFYLAGDARLTNSGYLAERANLRNEAAVALVSLGHYQEAYDMASSAQKLAEKAGDQKRVAMASGNQGLALMHLRRFQEALDVFEKVAKLEESLGDTEGLANTRFNLDQVRMLMGDYSNLT